MAWVGNTAMQRGLACLLFTAYLGQTVLGLGPDVRADFSADPGGQPGQLTAHAARLSIRRFIEL